MQIGAVSFQAYQPYVYNANSVSKNSLNKISAIGDDLTTSKLDASALVSDESKKAQNENPLKPGQSLDFAGIIQMQMQMSRLNEARIMQPAQPAVTENTQEPAADPNEILKAMPDRYFG